MIGADSLMPPKRRSTKRSEPDQAAADSITTEHASTTNATVMNTHARAATRASKRRKADPAAATTNSTSTNDVDEEMKEGVADDANQVMREADAPRAAATTIQPLINGILKLPQSIASDLASDYLVKREICDLGVTCRWMLVSLNQCVIKEPISLEVAHRRLNRERIVAASHQVCQKTANVREVVARVPNLFIGRFRSLRFAPPVFKSAIQKQFSELGGFVDVRTLVIDFQSSIDHKLSQLWTYPIELPPQLSDLIIERDGGLPPLNQFTLPPTLRRIKWPAQSFYAPLDLTQIQWPPQLTAIENMPNRQVFKNLVLPPSLKTFTFSLNTKVPITDLLLPHSITNLCINDWISDSGSYHDLPFPRALKRLAFSGETIRDDFNLNEWTHLPSTCTNLELTLIGAWFNHSSESKPPIHITMPPFIQQLRVFREKKGYLQPVPIHLANATALTSLVVDLGTDIEWPTSSTSALTSLKLIGQAENFFLYPGASPPPAFVTAPVPLPSSVTSLDLSEVFYWSKIFPPSTSSLVWSTIFPLPQLCQIKIPRSHDNPRDVQLSWNKEWIRHTNDLMAMIDEWGRTFPSCTIEGLVYANRLKKPAPPTATFQRFKNQVQIHQFTPTASEIQAMEELDGQQYDTIPSDPTN